MSKLDFFTTVIWLLYRSEPLSFSVERERVHRFGYLSFFFLHFSPNRQIFQRGTDCLSTFINFCHQSSRTRLGHVSQLAPTGLPATINWLMLVPPSHLFSNDNFALSGLLPFLTRHVMLGFLVYTTSFCAMLFYTASFLQSYPLLSVQFLRGPLRRNRILFLLVNIWLEFFGTVPLPSVLSATFQFLVFPPTLNLPISSVSVVVLSIPPIWDHHWSFHFNSVPPLPSAALTTARKSIFRLCSEIELDSQDVSPI
ncbi:hypothetical protein PHYBLDRAFT_65449 [Phycomyces blakesleeanus NRRL 1555(-)]|uniref:Uncharacterized protein n=1 Tax=Phycomyces blakesleeanus (strain ATCC 8743b / DSM 1359 / FGSC 10004 / NBRC 33097 / NRRL 1555) TaxID=763407 RepID=A0A162U0K5_PHYB8|nr:hypothetical protein PHYBLDRAFT_65449 [Phycomyces blakesleeanus NRRL 1555(-)]OAD72512.1 hypothetical protein PHYBLDRAFT_65449 [Phycomyces blakesleeanus NRRL 1555(-)]|eukprot:XP_018290552.1 hypothetical protein PHYBLDRAFT_65449 [Phycomyces blakesleeanus NRRL 1555(-)]